MRKITIDFQAEVIRTPMRDPCVDIRGGLLVKVDGVPITLYEDHTYSGDYPFLQLRDLLRMVPNLLAGEKGRFVMFGERTVLEIMPRGETAEITFTVGEGYRGEKPPEPPEGGPYKASLQDITGEVIRASEDFLEIVSEMDYGIETKPHLEEFDQLLQRAKSAYHARFGAPPPREIMAK